MKTNLEDLNIEQVKTISERIITEVEKAVIGKKEMLRSPPY